jgi:hypothetical protein
MKHHKLGFANRPVHEQLAICQRVADGVARLPAAHREALAEIPIADSTEAAAQACAAVETAKHALKAALHDRKLKLRAAREHAHYVGLQLSARTAGDPAAFLQAGLEIAKVKQPVGRPDAPENLRALATEFEGKVRLRWQRPVRRCYFDIEATTDPSATTGWKQVAGSLRQTCEVSGLESGKKYWFRVAASNAHGQGPWSQAVCVRVK